MAYDYYRNSMPGWGTSQFQFGSPPAPMFQPQPSWGGLDFYNAHAINPDPMFYNSIMARAPSFGAMGLGRDQARYWHKRIYSGMVPLTQVLPNDIGAAAAYEAYRMWKHNSFLYEPLSADRVQQREGLIGMAIAEATRLWQYAGRPADTYGLRAASEAAAAAASILADRWLGYVSSGGGLGGIGAPSYASSGASGYGYRPRRGSFAGASAGVGGPPLMAGGSPYLGAGLGVGAGMGGISPVGSPILGAGAAGMGAGAMAAGGSPMMAGVGGGVIPPPLPAVSPMPGVGAGMGVGGMGAGLGGRAYSPGMGMGPGMAGGGLGAGMAPGMGGMGGMGGLGGMGGVGGMSGAGGMGGMGGMGTGTDVNVQTVPAGSTIIFDRPGRSSRRYSGGEGRRRARSVDVIQTEMPGMGGGYSGVYGGGVGMGMGGMGRGPYGGMAGGGPYGSMYGGAGRIYGM